MYQFINILNTHHLLWPTIIAISIVLLYFFFVFKFAHNTWNNFDKRIRIAYIHNNFNIYNIILLSTWIVALLIIVYSILYMSLEKYIGVFVAIVAAFMASSAAMKSIHNIHRKDRISEAEQFYKKYKILKVQIYKCKMFLQDNCDINDRHLWNQSYQENALISGQFASFFKEHDYFSDLSVNLISLALLLETAFNRLSFLFEHFDELKQTMIIREKRTYRTANSFDYQKIETLIASISKILDKMDEEVGNELNIVHRLLELEKQTNIRI